MDEETKARIRRYNNNIVLSGAACIVFSVWDLMKFVMFVTTGTMDSMRENMIDLMKIADEDWDFYKLILYIVFAVVYVVVISVHLFIGINAMRFGNGRKFLRGFILFACIMEFVTILGIPSYFRDADELDISIASMWVDFTMIYLLFDMIYSTIRVKHLRKLIPLEAV